MFWRRHLVTSVDDGVVDDDLAHAVFLTSASCFWPCGPLTARYPRRSFRRRIFTPASMAAVSVSNHVSRTVPGGPIRPHSRTSAQPSNRTQVTMGCKPEPPKIPSRQLQPASFLIRSARCPNASFTYFNALGSAPCARKSLLKLSRSESHCRWSLSISWI